MMALKLEKLCCTGVRMGNCFGNAPTVNPSGSGNNTFNSLELQVKTLTQGLSQKSTIIGTARKCKDILA